MNDLAKKLIELIDVIYDKCDDADALKTDFDKIMMSLFESRLVAGAAEMTLDDAIAVCDVIKAWRIDARNETFGQDGEIEAALLTGDHTRNSTKYIFVQAVMNEFGTFTSNHDLIGGHEKVGGFSPRTIDDINSDRDELARLLAEFDVEALIDETEKHGQYETEYPGVLPRMPIRDFFKAVDGLGHSQAIKDFIKLEICSNMKADLINKADPAD